MAAMPAREAVRLLDLAHEYGIRHFDTARMYGHGRTEALLGQMARGKRDSMVIVSKAGIEPPSRWGRAFARVAPSLRAVARLGEPRFGRFSPAAVEASVRKSLTELGADYLDALLLHEIEPAQMSDELAALLQTMKRQGRIRAIGLATSAAHTLALQRSHETLFDIVQIPCASLIQTDISAFRPARVILHSVLGERLQAAFDQLDPEFAAKHGLAARPTSSEETRRQLAQLLMRTAIARNPGGVVLFASAKDAHIRLNASLTGAEEGVANDVERLIRSTAG
ncbi:MAG: aldo/keto reductase [Hyphomonadaceae bacterium]|nr:aldo/keto reductase [Hyphomonadaceae bacterium]